MPENRPGRRFSQKSVKPRVCGDLFIWFRLTVVGHDVPTPGGRRKGRRGLAIRIGDAQVAQSVQERTRRP